MGIGLPRRRGPRRCGGCPAPGDLLGLRIVAADLGRADGSAAAAASPAAGSGRPGAGRLAGGSRRPPSPADGGRAGVAVGCGRHRAGTGGIAAGRDPAAVGADQRPRGPGAGGAGGGLGGRVHPGGLAPTPSRRRPAVGCADRGRVDAVGVRRRPADRPQSHRRRGRPSAAAGWSAGTAADPAQSASANGPDGARARGTPTQPASPTQPGHPLAGPALNLLCLSSLSIPGPPSPQGLRRRGRPADKEASMACPRRVLAGLLACWLVAGCGGDDGGGQAAGTSGSTSSSTSTAGPISTTKATTTTAGFAGTLIEARVSGGKVETVERRVSVKRGEQVRIQVESDASDEVHVHGYDLKRPVGSGKPAAIEFAADLPGVYEVELEAAQRKLFELEVR